MSIARSFLCSSRSLFSSWMRTSSSTPRRALRSSPPSRGVPAGDVVLVPWRTQLPDRGCRPRARAGRPAGRDARPPPPRGADLRQGRGKYLQDDETAHHRTGQPHGARRADCARHPVTTRRDGVALVHPPVRSAGPAFAKVINGWQAYLVKNRHAELPIAGYQQRFSMNACPRRRDRRRPAVRGGARLRAGAALARAQPRGRRPGTSRGPRALRATAHRTWPCTRACWRRSRSTWRAVRPRRRRHSCSRLGVVLGGRRAAILFCGLLSKQIRYDRRGAPARRAHQRDGPAWVREPRPPTRPDRRAARRRRRAARRRVPAAAFEALAGDPTQRPRGRVVWWRQPPSRTPSSTPHSTPGIAPAGSLTCSRPRATGRCRAFPELRGGAVVLHPPRG